MKLCLQRERLEAQWAQSVAALLLELPKGQRAYTAATFDRYTRAVGHQPNFMQLKQTDKWLILLQFNIVVPAGCPPEDPAHPHHVVTPVSHDFKCLKGFPCPLQQ